MSRIAHRRLSSILAHTTFHSRSFSSTMARGRLNEPILLVCDLQEKFQTAIHQFPSVLATTRKLLRASTILSIPVAASTQNASKLGPTVSSLALSSLPNLVDERDKTRFSMWTPAADFQSLVKTSKGEPRDVILVGIETHICITQTALDFLAAGHRVYVCSDGVSSCNREEKAVALGRLAREGVVVTTSESVLYEVMGDASIPEFRDVVKLVRESKEETAEALRVLHS